MQTEITDADMAATGLLLSFSLRMASGKLVEIYRRPAHELVNTSDLQSTRDTVARIVSECLRAGIECSQPQALAAAYSVPDGAPIGMAIINVGPMPSDVVCACHDKRVAKERANVRAIRKAMVR